MSSDDTLNELRKQIDAIDEELLKTLARRMEVVAAVGRHKKDSGMELRDQQRLEALLSVRLKQADSLNLPKELVAELYELIHRFALAIEAEA